MSNKDTKYGPQVIGSPLSFHLSALEFNFTVVTNLEPAVNFAEADSPDICRVNLPINFQIYLKLFISILLKEISLSTYG